MSTLAIVTAVPAALMQPHAGPAQPALAPEYVEVWASNLLEQIEMVKGLAPVGYAQAEFAAAQPAPAPPPAALAPPPAQPPAQPKLAAAARSAAPVLPMIAFAGPVTAPALPQAAPVAPQAIWVQPQTAFVQPEAGEALPLAGGSQQMVVTYNLAPGDSSVQGPPSPDPLANDIVWANAQTAYHKRQVEREAWRKIVPYEIAWQLLNALDVAQTISCSRKPTCNEANPLFGSRPSVGTVLGIKGALGIGHFFLMRHLAHRNWKTARTAEIGTILVQGIIDGLNFRYAFK